MHASDPCEPGDDLAPECSTLTGILPPQIYLSTTFQISTATPGVAPGASSGRPCAASVCVSRGSSDTQLSLHMESADGGENGAASAASSHFVP